MIAFFSTGGVKWRYKLSCLALFGYILLVLAFVPSFETPAEHEAHETALQQHEAEAQREQQQQQATQEAEQQEQQRQQDAEQKQQQDAADSQAPSIGEDGFVAIDDKSFCPSKKLFDDLQSAVFAKDKIGFNEMLLNGTIVNIPKGTPIHMLESCGFSDARKVRVMGGDHTEEIWYATSTGLVKKLPKD
jgi:type II secretory pathway pseudopilin PulG